MTANSRIASRVQRSWDWRASGNFIGGGIGSGLILWSTLFALGGFDSSLLMLLGLALVGAGLFCVWLEIGRPWRALNVFKHFSKSWMSREAWVAPLLFLSGAATWLFEPLLIWPTTLLALAFLYSQSRILQADKGIPAWRHPRCAQLIVTTGLTEGCGLLVLLMPFVSSASKVAPLSWGLLLVLLSIRLIIWNHYRHGLTQANAPLASRKQLTRIDRGFLWAGHLIPAVLLVAALIRPETAMLAGILAFVTGAWMKYTLICKAAHTQGFSMQHQPVRGQPAPRRKTAPA